MSSKNTIERAAITTKDGKQYEIPINGSLGLLAIGYRGLMAWRYHRNEAVKSLKSQEKLDEKK